MLPLPSWAYFRAKQKCMSVQLQNKTLFSLCLMPATPLRSHKFVNLFEAQGKASLLRRFHFMQKTLAIAI